MISKGLNLGCGTNPSKSTEDIKFINVDIAQLEGVDMKYDLNVIPYPFEDNSIDLIIMNDILEHLDYPIFVLEECYRILKKGGKLQIKVVHWNHRYSYSDPQHKHAFCERYFRVFTGKIRKYYFDFHFENLKVDYFFDEKAIQKWVEKRFNKELSDKDKEFLLDVGYFHCNVIQGMKIELTKPLKEDD